MGADPALVSAAKGTATAAELTDWFTKGNPKNLLPFNYPTADKDLVASSWRNLGFCTNFGGDEVASVDFDNFATLYDHARVRPQYGANGFVEPCPRSSGPLPGRRRQERVVLRIAVASARSM